MKSASLRARGSLVRYLSQDVSAEQLLESFNSVQSTSQNNAVVVSQTDFERTAEIIRLQASDILKGATLVAECFDDERNLVFVKIGVSETVVKALTGFGQSGPAVTELLPVQDPVPAAGSKSFEKRSPNADLFE